MLLLFFSALAPGPTLPASPTTTDAGNLTATHHPVYTPSVAALTGAAPAATCLILAAPEVAPIPPPAGAPLVTATDVLAAAVPFLVVPPPAVVAPISHSCPQ